MALDSYNSTYPKEYYEVGTCYSFYVKHPYLNYHKSFPIIEDAPEEFVRTYAPKLNSITENDKKVPPITYNPVIMAQRVVGVVVGNRNEENCHDFSSRIAVMFRTNLPEHEYVLKWYATDRKSESLLDGWETQRIEDKVEVTGEIRILGGPVPELHASSGVKTSGAKLVEPEKKAGPKSVEPEKKSGPKSVESEKLAGPKSVEPEKKAGPKSIETGKESGIREGSNMSADSITGELVPGPKAVE